MVLINESEISKIKYLIEFDTKKTLFENTTPQFSQQQLDQAKKKITDERQKNAQLIYNELLKAFDRDNDKDLKDWDGTDEPGALKAINKIKYREELDYIEYLVKKQGQFKSLKDWLNSEMSDWDSEYGDIWNRLQKLGYLGRNTNYLYKVAGTMFKYSALGVLANLGENIINSVRNWTLEDWINWMRDAVNGTLGSIGLAMLNAIPVAGQIINFLANGLVAVGGAYQKFSSKTIGWFQFIIDGASAILSILGSSLLMKPLKVAFKSAGTLKKVNTLSDLLTSLKSKFPSIGKTINKIIQGGASAINSIISNAKKGIDLLIKQIPMAEKILGGFKSMIAKAKSWLDNMINEMTRIFTTETGETLGKEGGKKLASNLALTFVGKGVCKNGSCVAKWGKVQMRKLIQRASTNTVIMSGLKEAEKELITAVQKAIQPYALKPLAEVRPFFCSPKYGNWRKQQNDGSGLEPAYHEHWCTAFDYLTTAAVLATETVIKKDKFKKGEKIDPNLNKITQNVQKAEKSLKMGKAGTQVIKGTDEKTAEIQSSEEEKNKQT
jgi:hypothetical protein